MKVKVRVSLRGCICFILGFVLTCVCSSCTYIILPNAHQSPVGYDKEVTTKLKVPLVN